MTSSLTTRSGTAGSGKWAALAVGTFAQTAGTMFLFGIAFLIPALQREAGLSLTDAGTLVAVPMVGTVVTFIPWGILIDRRGERLVLVAGSALTAFGGYIAVASTEAIGFLALGLLVGGMGAAATNGASARVVLAGFPPQQRALAMGIRQTALSIGTGLGALIMPPLAAAVDLSMALWVPATFATVALAACLLVVAPSHGDIDDPPDLPADGNPYRSKRRWTLLRLHAVALVLNIPQCALLTFGLVWLHDRHHWDTATAGALITVANLAGMFARIGSGIWSDRVGSRFGPLRLIACASAAIMLALMVAEQTPGTLSAVLFVIAMFIASADRALVFIAAMEIAGPAWAGRSLGIQNTCQYIGATIAPPALAIVITQAGYSAMFLVVAVCAASGIALIPTGSPRIHANP